MSTVEGDGSVGHLLPGGQNEGSEGTNWKWLAGAKWGVTEGCGNEPRVSLQETIGDGL